MKKMLLMKEMILVSRMDFTKCFVIGFPKFFVLETVSFFLSVFIIWITSKNKKIGQYLYLIKE